MTIQGIDNLCSFIITNVDSKTVNKLKNDVTDEITISISNLSTFIDILIESNYFQNEYYVDVLIFKKSVEIDLHSILGEGDFFILKNRLKESEEK